MSETTIKALAEEAARALEGFARTGLAGSWQKGIDRLKALGIHCGHFEATADNARRLVNHLHLCNWL